MEPGLIKPLLNPYPVGYESTEYSIGHSIVFLRRRHKIEMNLDGLIFEDAANFSEGFGAVTLGDRWRFIETQGKRAFGMLELRRLITVKNE